MPALTIATDKAAPAASGATATAAATQPRSASPPTTGPPMSPITPPLNATRLPGDDNSSSSSAAAAAPGARPPPLTHTTQETPSTLPLAPGPEPIDFDANPDTIALKSAISVLQLQRRRATADIQALSRAKEEAVGDPEAFVRDLVAGKVNKPPGSGTDEEEEQEGQGPARQWTTLPKPQEVVRCPPINWSQYAVVGDSLDKLHAEQVARPTQGTPAAYIPGHAGMYEFSGGNGRQETYQGAAVPYNPVKDRVDRKATSKARK
ncbi:hypothetical protein LEL_02939 [Akanthomyces lecanii RCEF 1005]|uniref:Uncharacterized protein n=1 Tax=Akanthomyces lecanii RCEF 1005 TaxID=1081108 RepID=A0A168IMV6_CORDF|nr:hypothetical protein LEL_02939 [Akanthomyces lecanii RCEF 1005]